MRLLLLPRGRIRPKIVARMRNDLMRCSNLITKKTDSVSKYNQSELDFDFVLMS